MLVKKLGAAATALSSLWLVCMPAHAATLDYTISGTGSGSLNGIAFTDEAYTFTLLGDSANFSNTSYQVVDPLDAAEFSIAGVGSGTITIPTRLGESGDVVFFSRAGNGSLDLEDFTTPGESLLDNFGPVPGTGVFALYQFVDVATTAGALTLSDSSDVTFSNLAGAGAVPEPATWFMMLAGLGMAGLALRQRPRTVVAYS